MIANILLLIAILLMPVINIIFNYVIWSYKDPHKVDFEILNVVFYLMFYVVIICIAMLLNVASFRTTDWIITVFIMASLLLIYSIKSKNALRYLCIIFVIPVIEEYLYRFLIYSLFIGTFNRVVVILVVVSSISFSFLHYMQGKKEMAIKLLLSVILSATFIFTGEIMVVIIIHILYNLFACYSNAWRG